jgi:hypothetical protein
MDAVVKVNEVGQAIDPVSVIGWPVAKPWRTEGRAVGPDLIMTRPGTWIEIVSTRPLGEAMHVEALIAAARVGP